MVEQVGSNVDPESVEAQAKRVRIPGFPESEGEESEVSVPEVPLEIEEAHTRKS